ncbi:MAG TPA: 3-hydroxybutyryl-CoA dehydrogenase [Blastocatellia bacterium]|nr:3-hydroxybutyryl-CoA dehydrogenase [Blastocatellia bacterium]HAF24234.1 3-hydroxybutyryl-CoA dehydrogenase [Blastocatellia bacterium]HCX31988.1 3-hydroxybutyryl-CoA dehydrogenase [Blastocatellia bacterium]
MSVLLMSEIIGVVGSGTMGNGIAQVAARAGYSVVMRDVKDEFLQRGLQAIDKSLQRDVDKERLTAEDKRSIVGRINATTELDALSKASFVIEAVTEDLKVKVELFVALDKIVPPDAILASNTSSISITRLGAATSRPDKVIGMHFMNPVPVMKLVEVIRGIATSNETYEKVRHLAEKLGKTALDCHDSPGFISNRVLMPMINEAIFTLYEGVATRESIDGIMKLGMNHPMGPLTLADFIGLDVCLAILKVLYDGFGDPKYRACPLLKQYVDAGWLGKKSGRGFYEY